MPAFDDRSQRAGLADPTPLHISPPTPSPIHLSPSLRVDRGATAHEVKFLLTEETARELEQRATGGMILDPHTDPALGNAYRTTTLYCDSPTFHVFHGIGPGRKRKHRVRRYGLADFAFLERKTKRGSQVTKRRTTILLEELTALSEPPCGSEWPGEWFRERLQKRAMRPVCRVTYDRTAYAGDTAEGPLRLTFDRRLRGQTSFGWDLTPVLHGPDLLEGLVIVEFKFEGALPSMSKQVIEALRLEPKSASKYRRCVLGTGLEVGVPVLAPKPR